MKKPMKWIPVPAVPGDEPLAGSSRLGLGLARRWRRDRTRDIARVGEWENEGGALAGAALKPGNRA